MGLSGYQYIASNEAKLDDYVMTPGVVLGRIPLSFLKKYFKHSSESNYLCLHRICIRYSVPKGNSKFIVELSGPNIDYFFIDESDNVYFANMFKRDEASRIREEFWTAFGKYMSPIPSAEGMKINWINYRTGIKNLYFRMDANQKLATIYIALEHSDAGIRELYLQQFAELKTLLHNALEEEWEWQQRAPLEDKVISRIYKELPDVSIFNKDHWPELISFFKPRIIALDRFWENAKYSFEGLK